MAIFTPLPTRETHWKVLEISPWDSLFLRGETVKYFEVMNAICAKRPSASSGT